MWYLFDGVFVDLVCEICCIKVCIEFEWLLCGVDFNIYIKLGCGGLVDIEWIVQLLQLQYVYQVFVLYNILML